MRTPEELAAAIREGGDITDAVQEATTFFRSLAPIEQARILSSQGLEHGAGAGRGERQARATLPDDPRVAEAIQVLQRMENPPPDITGPHEQIEFLEGLVRSALFRLRTRPA